MKNFFKQIKAFSLLEAVCAVVFGILFIACPEFTKLTVVYLFASLLVLIGIIGCINYFCYGIEPLGFIKGIINIALGIIFFVIAQSLVDAGIFAIAFGIIFVVKGLFSMQWSFDCKRLGAKYWWMDTIFAALIFALGITILCNPSTENVLLIILGATLIVDGLMQFIDTLVVSAKIKKAKKSVRSLFENITSQTDDEQ